ncbi:histidinol-phosphate transaminase [Polaribacter vadi]|uniref:histidinol-phosphate transaminase n=1 Tax=Polaribacter TaxID=52959 RepID=UPI001C085029|nr:MULTISPECIES: histidinol-phosphate transaminase [Polaribacter]MBU3012045.1 histidinol-phosphate transaminase [Polaribacter vadi]MDO6741860.1 histidinol-phosphate transaminase [Polaribacter sp. 1_MG-2023]
MKTDFNINNLVRENIKSLKPYSSARDEYKDITYNDMIFLDANENPFENGVNRYPDPQQLGVKDILSEIKGVDVENILLGNGSDEVLDLIYRAFCEPKVDNVITLPPTYGMYSVLADLNNIENKKVLLSTEFQPNIKEILSTVNKNTKILFLCSPNNPTGNSFTEKSIHELLIKFKGLVVIDEAYIDFSTQKSWLKKIEKFPNLIITQTLSKAYGLAGIRLGVCYASKAIIKILNNIKPPYNVNELTQQRAVNRLQKIDEINNEVAQLISERKRLKQELESSINFIEKVYPSDGNFLLLKVDDANKRYRQLIEYGVVIRNRTTQPLCENCLRISVGICEENQRLIRALKSL